MALLPLVDQRWYLLRVRSRSGEFSFTVIELVHGVVLGSGASSLRAALRDTCARPKNGKPRRPRVVVVATEADLEEVKGAMPGVAVEVGPPPQHLKDTVLTDHLREKSSGGKRTLGWSEELFDEMFALADGLLDLEPWELLTDEDWVRVRAPWKGGEDGVLIVLGAARAQYGFLYFPEARAAERFAALTRRGPRSGLEPRDGTDLDASRIAGSASPPDEYFAFTLDLEHEVPPEVVLAGRRLCFHGPRYPLPMRVSGTTADLASPLDASRLVTLGMALGELVAGQREALERQEPAALTYEGIKLSTGGGVAASRADETPLDAGVQWRADDFALFSRLRALADELLPGWLEESGFEPSGEAMRDALELWPRLVSGPYRSTTPIAELRRLRPEIFDARVEAILAAQAVAWNGLWEVIAITRGQGFTARDLLTHEERFIRDVAASRSASERVVLCARIVTVGETSWISAADLVALGPLDADDARLLVCERLDLPRTKAVVLAKVLAPKVQWTLPRIWTEHREAVHARPLPELRTPAVAMRFPHRMGDGNACDVVVSLGPAPASAGASGACSTAPTAPAAALRGPSLPFPSAGEDLLIVEDGYTLDGPDLEAALSGIPGMERPAEARGSWTLRSGDGPFQSTSIARELQHWNATSFTLEQADRARAVLEEAFGEEVRHLGRAIERLPDRRPAATLAGPSGSQPSPPEVAAALLRFKSAHYGTWPDHPLPALEGKTPRQAMRTQKGRAKVERLLAELEHNEQANPPAERYDVDELRTALGLPLSRIHPGLPRH